MSSYPPALLIGSARPGRMRARLPGAGGGDVHGTTTGAGGAASTSPLTVAAGAPGTYSPAVSAAERPRNLTELAQRVTPPGSAPWAAGQSIPLGQRGKRAHWTGTSWAGGESPGYAPAGDDASARAGDDASGEVLDDVSGAADGDASSGPALEPSSPPADTQFPGDGGGSPEDLHR